MPCVLALLTSLTASPTPAAEVDLVADRPGRLRLEFYPEGSSQKEHPIQMLLEGAVYEEGRILRGDGIPPDLDGAESFLKNFLEASRQGTLDEVLTFWAPEHVETTRQNLTGTFEANQALHQRVQISRLLARVHWGGITLMCVRHELDDGQVIVSTYPLVGSDGAHALTQDLSEDTMYQLLYLAFREAYGLPGDGVQSAP